MKAFAKLRPEAGAMGLIERPEPTPESDEALVEVSHAALCGSDLGIFEFEDAFSFMEFPRIVGHEYAGTVLEVGEDVSRFAPGDRVAEEVIRGCGDCRSCATGNGQLCDDARVTGVHHDGAFAPYITVPERDLHRLPDDFDLRTGSLVEPTGVAARAVKRNARLTVGDTVFVEGPGPIGVLVALFARAQGARVVVSGLDSDAAFRLPLLEDLGFETVNVGNESVESVRAEHADGGFDVVFDATGHESGLRTAVEAVRKRGQIVVLGLTDRAELSFTSLVRGEVSVQCSYTYDYEDFESAIAFLRNDGVPVDRIVDDRFSLRHGTAAYEAALEKRTLKPVFDLDQLR